MSCASKIPDFEWLDLILRIRAIFEQWSVCWPGKQSKKEFMGM